MTPTPIHRQRGLTLIELVTVMAITAILTTTAWGGYQQHMLTSRRAEGRAALLRVLVQEERQFSYRHAYRAFQPGNGEAEFKWFSGERPERSAYHIAAQACEGEDLRSCVRVTATPAGIHHDQQCGALYVDTRGRRGAAGDSCW
ncbi:prepilin-type N-terminal cleavage/methylation domain-containing protein [Herbaspirillum sp. LeCh32-8]|uniref:type IV pilin protein n=1 Tax=Herbaspirillum sp. LeCh32-8 TaxID=2821356 RepID=UPI001AE4EFE0|nr:type IV pilin protein [Herbaspirillum sp. LeCh32-8]MBP0597607.1 prepilin-type N-terminal cleavage/methylation domain-containing protein [Herbaspirillum sp. LeCh32-8]